MVNTKYHPQPYTQSLLDRGFIEYSQSQIISDTETHQLFNINHDYLIMFNAEHFGYPRAIYSFIEIYINNKFYGFHVKLYDDEIIDWEENYIPNNLAIYKEVE